MDKESIKSHVDDNMVDLLLAYGLLQSIIEIFSEAEYYVAAEPPVRCGVSHLSGLTEPLI